MYRKGCKNTMKKETNYIGFEKALTDNEILLYSQLIIQFKNKEINFKKLEKIFLNYEITIEAIPNDIKRPISITEANTIKKRILEKDYLYDDINYFVLNSSKFKNVVFRIDDYKAIEVLANYGIPEYQEAMIGILMTQLKHSSNMNENLTIERNRWKRRIEELKSQLSKQDNLNKSK